jgi:hypothetical protein
MASPLVLILFNEIRSPAIYPGNVFQMIAMMKKTHDKMDSFVRNQIGQLENSFQFGFKSSDQKSIVSLQTNLKRIF